MEVDVVTVALSLGWSVFDDNTESKPVYAAPIFYLFCRIGQRNIYYRTTIWPCRYPSLCLHSFFSDFCRNNYLYVKKK